MNNVTRRSARRVGSGVAALVGLSAVALSAPLTANAAPSLALTRIGGESRYETAAQISTENFPAGQTQTVVLASGTSTVDALASAFVAGANNAPVLLTEPGVLPAATVAELDRLGAERVILAGGDSVISPEVEDQLATDYAVQRAAGDDRYETAALLAGIVQDAEPDVIFVAAGAVDAATVSPISAAAGWPVLLTSRDAVPEATERALSAYPDAEVVVLGGESAISEDTATELGAATRIEGSDRYETAVAIAEFAVEEAGFASTGFGVAVGRNGANGDDLADALTAGPALAQTQSPLLLAESASTLGTITEQYLEDNSDQFTGAAVVFGGPAVIGNDVVQTIAEATETTAPELPAADTTPPTLQTSSIRDGATGVAASATLDLAFSEVLSASATTVTLFDAGNGSAPVVGTTTYNGATLSFDPSINLAAGRTYVAVVRAQDLAGNATPEIRITFTAATAAPDAPTGLTLGATTASSQVLSWTAPASDGGSPLTGYTVNVYNGGAATGTPAQTISVTGAISATVSGLTPASTYTYTVTAENNVGTSSASNVVSGATVGTFTTTVTVGPDAGGTTGTAEIGETITVTFSTPIDVATLTGAPSVFAGGNNGNTSLTAIFDDEVYGLGRVGALTGGGVNVTGSLSGDRTTFTFAVTGLPGPAALSGNFTLNPAIRGSDGSVPASSNVVTGTF